MYILTYMYILAEISAYHFQLKCMGGHFFSRPSLHREYYRTLRYTAKKVGYFNQSVGYLNCIILHANLIICLFTPYYSIKLLEGKPVCNFNL